MMIYDRQITITTGNSRKSTNWAPWRPWWSELVAKTAIPVRGTETYDVYMSMSKGQQDDLKDVGGFVGGALKGPRRKAGAVAGRDILTLDLDNIPAGGTNTVLQRVEALGCGYCVYSTRKHSPAAPRLRILMPLDRTVTADEYEPIARKMAELIGIDLADPSTFEPSRLMYWPSCCSDSEYIYQPADKPLLSSDGVLAMYADWHDMSAWPQVPGAAKTPVRLADKQGDPEAKGGVVGAFCRTYDIYKATEVFLPGTYDPVPGFDDRFTYTGGSTTGGAIVYDNGKFLFSHHATDPCSGKLVNAFDLVRLHRFGDQDDTDDVKDGTPTNRLPSYAAMCELARSDKAVSDLLAREAFAAAAESSPVGEDAALDLGHCAGEPLSIDVVQLALKAFGITTKNNLITSKAEIIGLPEAYSSENAVNTLPVFLVDKLRAIGVKGVSKAAITDYLANIFDQNRYNPVTDMLNTTAWDGVSRFSELLKIMGVEPSSFSAVLIQKWLIQTVALAYNTVQRQEAAEGVLTLQSGQGIGKTMLFRKLAIQSEWLVEGASLDLRNKDSIINALSGWICELGELDSTLQRDQSSLKAFITSPVNRFRTPYAREATFNPRRTSFCASVNPGEFLRDETGDRRFWVVPIESIDLPKLKSLPNTWSKQLWAETRTLWTAEPERFRLTTLERQALDVSNRRFRQPLPGEVEIRERLNFDLPPDHWGEFSAADLMIGMRDKTDSRMIGKVLAKLAREEPRITRRTKDGYILYRLPVPSGLSVTQFGSGYQVDETTPPASG